MGSILPKDEKFSTNRGPQNTPDGKKVSVNWVWLICYN